MKKTGRMKLIVFLLVIPLILASTSSCAVLDKYIGSFLTDESNKATDSSGMASDIIESSTSESRFFVDVKPGVTDSTAGQDVAQKELQLDESFNNLIETCLAEGIANYSLQIDLTGCLTNYSIDEDQIDSLVSRLVDILEKIYMQDPLLFYLDGAMQVGYELQSAWGQRELSSLSVKLQRLPEYKSLTAEDIEAIQATLVQTAEDIAGLSGNGRADWEKMLIIHDELVRRIEYDTSLDQSVNNSASALLNGMTLCKGYAQSFKLVCDVLDLDCQVISGQSDGIEHAWNLVRIDNSYYHVDVTHDDPVPDRGTTTSVDHRHFLRSDNIMAQTHIWEYDKYPPSKEDGSHYFKQNDLTVSDIDSLSQKIQQFLLINNFSDERDDHLELLYLGSDLPDTDSLDLIFKDAITNSGLNLSFSYHLSAGKNVLQIIVLGN